MRISDWSSDVCSSDLSSSTGEIAFVPMRRRSSTAERAVRDIVSSMWTGAACLVDQPFRLRVRVARAVRSADLGVGPLGVAARQRRVRLPFPHPLPPPPAARHHVLAPPPPHPPP